MFYQSWIPFNPREQKFFLILCLILLCGNGLKALHKTYPQTHGWLDWIEEERIRPSIDVNKASQLDLEDIPYIGRYTALAILNYRKRHGVIRDVNELKSIKGIREKNFERFQMYLNVEGVR